jgi:putative oxidoreductase
MELAVIPSSWSPRLLSVLRFVGGLLFFAHGVAKLLHFPAPAPMPMSPMLFSAGVIELVGGALVALGLFTRPAAFIMAGEMAVAYFLVHMPRNFFPTQNGGDAAILFCFLFLYIAAAGPGPWSLDAKRA